MVRMYFLAIYLLLGCILMNAQGTVQVPPPCSDFNSTSNPAGNWNPSPGNGNVTVNFGSSNTLDGSQYLILGDLPFGSWYENSIDYRELGRRFLGQCLYFDFYLKNDSGFGQPYHPYITLSDGARSASFVANTAVTPGSGWVRVKAPIQLSSGGVLPSNSEGTWVLSDPSSTAADFDNIILNSKTLALTPDITSTQDEIVYFDNICVKSCDGCSANFKLDTSFSTQTNNVTVNLTLTNPILQSTPGNPGPIYIINWGDGTSGTYTYPTASHTYVNGNSYTICVSEKQGRAIVCTKCFTFCYKSPVVTSTISKAVSSPVQELKAIEKAELQAAGPKDFTLVPNPARSYVELQANLSERGPVSVRILDTVGKVVFEKSENLNSGPQLIRLNTENLIQGAYIVEMKSNHKTSSQKLLISK